MRERERERIQRKESREEKMFIPQNMEHYFIYRTAINMVSGLDIARAKCKRTSTKGDIYLWIAYL